MCPFTVGQEVVYAPSVNYLTDGYGDEQLPHRGHIYTIRSIEPDPWEEICLLLVEVRNKVRRYGVRGSYEVTMEPSWRWSDFRPLNKREEDLKVTLLLEKALKDITRDLASWVAR